MSSQTKKKLFQGVLRNVFILLLLLALGILHFRQTPTVTQLEPLRVDESFSIAANVTQAKTNRKDAQTHRAWMKNCSPHDALPSQVFGIELEDRICLSSASASPLTKVVAPCSGWTTTEFAREWKCDHVLFITLAVHMNDNSKNCIGCSVDVVLRSENSAVEISHEYTPSVTDSTGMITKKFVIGPWLGDNQLSMQVWAVVTSTNNVETAVIDPSTCRWCSEGMLRSFDDVWASICDKNILQQVFTNKVVLDVPSIPPAKLCAQYFGMGMWTASVDRGWLAVNKSRYHWNEAGCLTLQFPYDVKDISRVRIAFVGDSVMRNLFYEWQLWAQGKTNGPYKQWLPYKWVDGDVIEARYFETYGYYPVMHFNSSADPRCCGESDCVGRQQARNTRQGFTVLQKALNWLHGEQNKAIDTVLVLKTPIVHHARAYVSDDTHRQIVSRMLNMLRTRLDLSRNSKTKMTTIWMSANAMRSNTFKSRYLENRSARRYRMHKIELHILNGMNNASSNNIDPFPQLLRLDVWNMSQGRRDHYFDSTHVYPSTSAIARAEPHPRTVSMSWTAMLNTILVKHGHWSAV